MLEKVLEDEAKYGKKDQLPRIHKQVLKMTEHLHNNNTMTSLHAVNLMSSLYPICDLSLSFSWSIHNLEAVVAGCKLALNTVNKAELN